MLVFWYLYACVRQKVVPWHFFQLNNHYFNEVKGIFSKLEMDALIPRRWRLTQYVYHREQVPKMYPVFLKPEWGQNANGIIRVLDENQYRLVDQQVRHKPIPYIVQPAAAGKKEFEIYYLRSPENSKEYGIFSITLVNNRSAEHHPVNSIHNPDTTYLDITSTFAKPELAVVWNHLKLIGDFRMARICLKADSEKAVQRGDFQVVEVNLFLPMPLFLLASNVEMKKKQHFIRKIMRITARLVKQIPREKKRKSIFFRKMQAHYRSMR